MTGRVLAGIALRVWGVVYLVDALIALPHLVTWLMISYPTDASSKAMVYAQNVSMVLNAAATMLVGVCLIALADRIAAATVPETEPLVVRVDSSDLTILAFAVTAVVILVWGLKDLGSLAYAAVAKPSWIGAETWLSYEWREDRDVIVRAIVELAAGTALWMGRNGIANAWRLLRRPADEAPDDRGALP